MFGGGGLEGKCHRKRIRKLVKISSHKKREEQRTKLFDEMKNKKEKRMGTNKRKKISNTLGSIPWSVDCGNTNEKERINEGI